MAADVGRGEAEEVFAELVHCPFEGLEDHVAGDMFYSVGVQVPEGIDFCVRC